MMAMEKMKEKTKADSRVRKLAKRAVVKMSPKI
jgi:hypothetical protein